MSTIERLYRSLPAPVGSLAKRAWFAQARLTAGARALPDFVIIGAQRCGTTSLYEYLVADPGVRRALTKEVRFVDVNHGRGEAWYRAHFPTRRSLRGNGGTASLTGEASPDYLWYPEAPRRLRAVAPEANLIVVLRDPVERAYSHYWHQRRRGFEPLSFAEAIEVESARCGEPEETAAGRAGPMDHARHHFAYVGRGLYAPQLERWLAEYPRSQMLILESDDLFGRPGAVVARAHEFLGLAPPAARDYPVYNRMGEGSVPVELRQRLRERFDAADRALAGILGATPSWRAAS